MFQSKAPAKFWAEAINTANYIRNRCISKSLNYSTPFKIWTGNRPNVSYFQVFGIKAFVLDKGPYKRKFDSKSKNCTFLGYSNESKAYRLWCDREKKIIVSRDVVFTKDFNFCSKYEDYFDSVNVERENQPKEPETNENENIEVILHDSKQLQQEVFVHQNEKIVSVKPSTTKPKAKRKRGRPMLVKSGKRGRPKKSYHYNTNHPHNDERNIEVQTPNESESEDTIESAKESSEYESANFIIGPSHFCISEVLATDDAEKWKVAINQEYVAIVKNKTFEIVNRPKNVNLIKSRFVLTQKQDNIKNTERKKARLVARGFAQRKGTDYNETFSPVVRTSSIRILMALAVKYGWRIHQMDVVTAYPNGELTEKVYMEIPELFEENLNEIVTNESLENDTRIEAKCLLNKLKDKENKVCLLKKSLYGLKQSGRQWYCKLDKELKELGLEGTNADPCIYIQKTSSDTLILAVYVDDLLLISNNESSIKKLKDKLMKKFEMKDLGRIRNCLGIEFEQSNDNKIITMCQKKYTQEILNRFRMNDCKPAATPLDANSKLQKGNKLEESVYPYQSLIGCLMYLAISIRPDISFAVSMLSQYNNCHSQEHCTAAKRVLRYLRKTLDYGLVFKNSECNLTGYADSDWGASIDDRRSYTGYVYINLYREHQLVGNLESKGRWPYLVLRLSTWLLATLQRKLYILKN